MPQKGDNKKLLQMALTNLQKNFSLSYTKEMTQKRILEKMQKFLNLKTIPTKIECFDISHIQNKNIVAAMVVTQNNQFKKEQYRKFKINSSAKDDTARMKEVLKRRWQKKESELPNLTLIDGGKAQLNLAFNLAKKMNIPLEKMDLLAIAKGRSLKRKVRNQENREIEFDYLLQAGQKEPILLKSNLDILRPLQKIRDEAHRFAISFHRKVRNKESLSSPLLAIAKIGAVKRKNLILNFKNIENIRNAAIKELQKVPKISKNDAKMIYQYFHSS